MTTFAHATVLPFLVGGGGDVTLIHATCGRHCCCVRIMRAAAAAVVVAVVECVSVMRLFGEEGLVCAACRELNEATVRTQQHRDATE